MLTTATNDRAQSEQNGNEIYIAEDQDKHESLHFQDFMTIGVSFILHSSSFVSNVRMHEYSNAMTGMAFTGLVVGRRLRTSDGRRDWQIALEHCVRCAQTPQTDAHLRLLLMFLPVVL